jgi:hypothetical protein|tara:strand:- start:556 stop:993 length:438 start_codon:yes stop_codon:yes gene_type:complete
MALTDNVSTVTQYLVDQLDGEASLGFTNVFFGDQDIIPSVPCASVEPGILARELIEARRFVQAQMEFIITVYVAQMENRQTNLKNALLKAEATRDKLDTYQTCGDIVIFSYCTSMEVGTALRGNNLLAAARITFYAISQVQLPSA